MQELVEEPKIDYEDINDLIVKYENLRDYCRRLMSSKQKLQNRFDDLSNEFEEFKVQTTSYKHESIKPEVQRRESNTAEKKEMISVVKNGLTKKSINIIKKDLITRKLIPTEENKLLDTYSINRNLLIDSTDLHTLSLIGQGASSTVYKARYKELLVAAKKMIINDERPQQAMVSISIKT
jgi:hypothetical protein